MTLVFDERYGPLVLGAGIQGDVETWTKPLRSSSYRFQAVLDGQVVLKEIGERIQPVEAELILLSYLTSWSITVDSMIAGMVIVRIY